MDIFKSAEAVNINPEPASPSPSSLGHIALFIGGFEGRLKDQFIELNKDHIWTPPSRDKVLQTHEGSFDGEQPEPWRGDVRADITLDGPILCHSFLSPPIRSYGWHHGAESDTSKSTLGKPRDILYPLNATSGISSSAFRIDYTTDANHKHIPRLTPLVLKSSIDIQIGTLYLKRTFNDQVDLTEPAKIHLPGLSFWMWIPRLNEDEQEVFTANVSAFIYRANCLDEGFFPGMASTSDATLAPTPSFALPYETPGAHEKRERRTGLSLTVYERRKQLSKGGFRKVYLVDVISRPYKPKEANPRPHAQIPQFDHQPKPLPRDKTELVAKEIFQKGDGSESAKQFYRNMMEREYSIITNNPHPHVNAIIDIAYSLGTDANPWLIEEKMPHCLETFLRDGENPPFPLDAEDTMRQLLSVLIHYDESGIIHTDIKPGNVLMELVEGVGGERSRWHFKMSDHNTSRLTSRSVEGLAGTPFYCAPEVLDNKPYGKTVDVFSLGILFVDLLVGHSLSRNQPFGGEHPQSSSELGVWMNLVGVFIDGFCDPKHHPLLKNMLMRDPLKRWRPAQCLAFLNDTSQSNDQIASVFPVLSWTSSLFTEKQLRWVRKRGHYHLGRNDIEHDDPAVGHGQQPNDADSDDETILEPRVAQFLNDLDSPGANAAQFRDEDADEDEDQDDNDDDIVNLSLLVNESMNRFRGTGTSERGSYVTALEFQVEDDGPVTSKPSYAAQMPVTPCPGTPRDELLSVPCTPADDDCATYPAARRRADEPEFYDFSNSEWDWELENSDDMSSFIESYIQITGISQPSSQQKDKMTEYGLALLEKRRVQPNNRVKLGNRHLSPPINRKARNEGAPRRLKHEPARDTVIMQPIGIFNHQLPGPTTSRRAMKRAISLLEHTGDNRLDAPKRPRPKPELEHENMATPRPSKPTSPEGVPQSTAPVSPSVADSEAETVIEGGEDQQPEARNGANTEAPPAMSPVYDGMALSAKAIVLASQRTGDYRSAPADASTRKRTTALHSMMHSSLGIGMGTIR